MAKTSMVPYSWDEQRGDKQKASDTWKYFGVLAINVSSGLGYKPTARQLQGNSANHSPTVQAHNRIIISHLGCKIKNAII